MFLHHVVNTKELVLMTGVKAKYDEVATYKESFEELEGNFRKVEACRVRGSGDVTTNQFNTRQESHNTEQ